MTRVDSTGVVSSHINLKQDLVTRLSADVLFDTKQESIGDTFTMTTDEVTNADAEKKAKRKKWLVAAGVALGVVALGVTAYLVTKKPPVKAVENLSGTIAGDLPEKLSKMDDFDVFKDLKMCRDLSMEETVQAHKILMRKSNKDVFLATLTGNKPVAIIGDSKLQSDQSDTYLDIIKKLKLGKNFEVIDANKFEINGFRSWNKYFVNKDSLLETIKQNKDIYTNALKLPENSSCKTIYKTIFEHVQKNNGLMPDDILGISLGFPRYDSMIFNLESLASLGHERCSMDYIKKMMSFFYSEKSPYKNIDPSRYKSLEEAISNINQQNLVDIGKKGSYCDGVYAFINFCDDTAELTRIAKSTERYSKFRAITP